ncbi:MAG: recombination mediator RecR [Candidatus Nomurabacteria bacterium]|jgi:recombination protein RecR|nr:recombination mediator RecR [Candidatus Nomurabacteria bacterium]
MLPKALKQVIDDLGKLPGVGARTAERYAYYLFKGDSEITDNIVDSLSELHSGVKFCPITFALIDASEEVSSLYADGSRDKTTVLVVQDPLDIVAVERTGGYKGTYHVLGGAISPIDDIGPDELHISELINRIGVDGVEEVIIATNASVEGESTAIFLQRALRDKHPELKISRLARGIPVGVDLEYADQITLSHALEGRREF